MSNQVAVAHQLRLSWAVAALACGLGLAVGYLALTAWWGADQAWQWLIFASAVSIYVLLALWRYLPDNHLADHGDLLPTLGAATGLTLARGLLLGYLAGFLLLPRPSGGLAWIPAACYGGAALADYFDGYLARITRHATLLGEKFDLDLDALGILLAPLLGVLYGQLPIWYLLVSAARYVFAGVTALLKRAGRPVYNLTDSPCRRPLAGLQMGLNVVVLLPVYTPPGTLLAATLFMLPFLSGFVRDGFVVTGALDPQSNFYRRLTRTGEQIFLDWLPLPLRIVLLPLLTIFCLQGVSGSTGLIQSLLPLADPVRIALFTIVLIVTGGLILLGVLGRLSAVILLLAAGLPVRSAGLDPVHFALIAAAALIVVLGTGRLSLWQPEEVFLRYHAGVKTLMPVCEMSC